MKIFLALFLVGVLIFSMIACTPDRNDNGTRPITLEDTLPDTADPTAPAHTNGLNNGRNAHDPVA